MHLNKYRYPDHFNVIYNETIFPTYGYQLQIKKLNSSDTGASIYQAKTPGNRTVCNFNLLGYGNYIKESNQKIF